MIFRIFSILTLKKCRFCRTILFLVGCWLIGFIGYFNQIPRTSVLPEKFSLPAGVILTGGPGLWRIEYGIKLLLDRKVDRLLISGVDPSVSLMMLLTPLKSSFPGHNIANLSCCIELGHAAKDTIGNAEETKNWVEQHDYRQLVIVTSDYHLLRSLKELQAAMPKVTLYYLSVPSDFVTKLDQGKIRINYVWKLIGEYNKFLLVSVRQLLNKLLHNHQE